jgi:hypothetical protein
MDFLIDSCSFQLAIVIVGAVAGLGALGGFNGARVAMGAVGVLILASANIIVSEGRRLASSPLRFERLVELLGGAMAIMAIGCALGLYFLPPGTGHAILGGSFQSARSVLLPMGLYWAGRAIMSSARIAMRVTRPGLGAVILQLMTAPLTLAAVAIGAALGEGAGAAWGLFIVVVPLTIVWLRNFRGSLRTPIKEQLLAVETIIL